MIKYEVKADPEDIKEAVALFEFVGGNTSDALRVAINKTGPKVRTKSSAEIRAQIRIKATYLNAKDSSGKQRLSFTRATRKKLTGAISTPSRGLLLSKFSTDTRITNDKTSWILPPKPPARGIKVKVKPNGSPRSVGRSAFYMVLPKSRALAIVRRKDTLGPKGGKIDVLYGPSVSQVFNDVRDKVTPFAEREYQSQLIDAMRFVLQKKFPKE